MNELVERYNFSRKIELIDREPIHINASMKLENNGMLMLHFSEPLFGEKEFKKLGINMTYINEIRFKILNLTYIVVDEDIEL